MNRDLNEETGNKDQLPLIESQSITVLDLVFIFLKHRKKILIFTGFISILTVVLYFLVFDLIYYSYASVKSSSKSSSIMSSLESFSDLGAFDEIGLAGGKSAKDLASYEEILTSRRCVEHLIEKFGLIERDKYRNYEEAFEDIKSNKIILKQERVAGLLTIGIFDKNPQIAKEMVDFLIEELDRINIELNIQNAKNNREFIEKRYYQAKMDLAKAEDTLKAFQLIYGVSPDLQVKAAAQTEFTIESELKAEEVKLDVLRNLLSPDQIEVKTQEAKINSLKSQINKIQNSTDLSQMLRLGNSPIIVMSFLRLERDVEIQSKIVSFLLPVYEQAKIDERKETPTIQVLDKPYVAEKKSKPKRATMVLVFTFSAFILSLVSALFYERLKIYKKKYMYMRTLGNQ